MPRNVASTPHISSSSPRTNTSWGCLSLPVSWLLPPFSVLFAGLLMSLFLPTAPPTSPSTNRDLASFFTPEVQYWATDIRRWSAEHGLDPNLVATVMQIESCGNPRAVSPAGAIGLFQVMPYHFAAGENPYHPDTNARRGLAYLSTALQTHRHNTRLALAAYNGGIAGSQRSEIAWPAETRRYVYWGEQIYQDARAGKTYSARLNEWLSRGGNGLCAAAAAQLGILP
ncbi:MAG: hypothetical protein D6803_02720 [Anaerolineae bacterium]|nr:MAG: hypothetical protein D6803_02720 [Anaerolineae bacterium]